MQNAVETRRTRYLLSGLLVCGCCGNRYVKHNRTSYRCREALKGGVCTNTRTISRKRIEARVFARLKEVMLSDELARQFGEALEAERRKLAKANPEADVKRLSAALKEAETKRARIFQAIEDGAPFATFKARANEVEAEIADIAARIEGAKRLITLQHADQPDARLLYERAVAQMELLLGDEELVEQAHAFLGELIRKIALRPDEAAPHGVSAVIEARFGALLGVEEAVTDAAGFTMVPC
ncbi:zinc ribbon domain-containing protein [Salipiger sp. H15]|uniref:Zinc ribbon domain-containing protein n=1 Tax=Alloyangia sp. H15 TaxID=3029062 RepID=A0AAU8AIQ0_9RHOB